jgi:tRNA pseudouridine55 synthase
MARPLMARRRPPTVHGLAVVDKPAGVTSHDVVAMLRRRLGERQIGHSGTLDPAATGVMLLGVGRVTKVLRYLTALGKTYTGEVVFGATTSTLDDQGELTGHFEMAGLRLDDVRSAAAQHLTGDIMQIPPMVSALKVDGRRLHELAREGIEVERAPRPVTVRRFEVGPTSDPLVFRIEVECSSGTYVRTLADDLGRLLGGGAHLRRLRRTAVGSFGEDEAAAPDVCTLLPAATALRDYPSVRVDAATAAMVRQGRVLPAFDGAGPWAVLTDGGELLAVYESFRSGTVKPAVVLV